MEENPELLGAGSRCCHHSPGPGYWCGPELHRLRLQGAQLSMKAQTGCGGELRTGSPETDGEEERARASSSSVEKGQQLPVCLPKASVALRVQGTGVGDFTLTLSGKKL